MSILSKNNRFDLLLAIFLARSLHNYKKIPSMQELVRGIRANPLSLFGRGITIYYVVSGLQLKVFSSKLRDGFLGLRFFRSTCCRLICSDKEGPTMYTICHQILTIGSASGAPPVLPRPS